MALSARRAEILESLLTGQKQRTGNTKPYFGLRQDGYVTIVSQPGMILYEITEAGRQALAQHKLTGG